MGSVGAEGRTWTGRTARPDPGQRDSAEVVLRRLVRQSGGLGSASANPGPDLDRASHARCGECKGPRKEAGLQGKSSGLRTPDSLVANLDCPWGFASWGRITLLRTLVRSPCLASSAPESASQGLASSGDPSQASWDGVLQHRPSCCSGRRVLGATARLAASSDLSPPPCILQGRRPYAWPCSVQARP